MGSIIVEIKEVQGKRVLELSIASNHKIKGEEIKIFELWIFNRWGELIYNTKTMSDSWNGTFKNMPVQIDTYVWKIKYVDFQNNNVDITGHINVLR